MWRAFADGPTFAAVIDGLAAPWVGAGVTRVVGVEARGFLLGGAVALRLGVGFHAVRKPGALFPGPKRTTTSDPDYRGIAHALSMQDSLTEQDVVLIVDDWAQRGSQALAVRRLVEETGATYGGLSVIVDQLAPERRAARTDDRAGYRRRPRSRRRAPHEAPSTVRRGEPDQLAPPWRVHSIVVASMAPPPRRNS